ncbi:MAG: PEP-CTERM sorting domain-containing protein [Gammaproteobacteria bacterium]
MNLKHAVAGMALLLGAAAAQADTYSYTGDTTGGPVVHRPITRTRLSDVGTAVPYHALQFSVDLSGLYSLNSVSYTADFDNYTALYHDSFNPQDPLANLILTNDDYKRIPYVSGFDLNLVAGTPYVFLNLGFENSDVGQFEATISGAGQILVGTLPVPEPDSWLMLAGGLGVLAMLRKRHAANG